MALIGTEEWLNAAPRVEDILSYLVVSQACHIVETEELPARLEQPDFDRWVWGPEGAVVLVTDSEVKGSYLYFMEPFSDWLYTSEGREWLVKYRLSHLDVHLAVKLIAGSQVDRLRTAGEDERVVSRTVIPCFAAKFGSFYICSCGLSEEGNDWVVRRIAHHMQRIYSETKNQ
jgi:hypothetical protein